jgi:hypothetical protein
MFLRTVFFAIVLTLAFGANARAQRASGQTELKTNMPDASGRPEKTYAPGDPMLENLVKMKIRAEEKEHAEFVGRGEEVSQLTEQISKSYALSGAALKDLDKLNQLEKTVKKIRKNLGGSDKDKNETPESNPASVADAMTKLAEVGANLGESVKTSTRYTISADSIDNANELLELINFIRRAPR